MSTVLLPVVVQDYVRIGSRQWNRVIPAFMALVKEAKGFWWPSYFKVGMQLNRNPLGDRNMRRDANMQGDADNNLSSVPIVWFKVGRIGSVRPAGEWSRSSLLFSESRRSFRFQSRSLPDNCATNWGPKTLERTCSRSVRAECNKIHSYSRLISTAAPWPLGSRFATGNRLDDMTLMSHISACSSPSLEQDL